jgi:tripartite-type tricarboxylate transporter receptor subunit TctC
MKTSLSFLVLGFLPLFALSAAGQQPARAEGYPTRPVRVVVPYQPGAAADIIGRLVAQKLSELSGAQFYVENLGGAGGTIGTGAAARAPADGHTLLIVNQDFVVQPLVKSKVPYDPFKSFTPVATVAAAPETIAVHPSVPAANMKELMSLIKANPGKYTYASPGYGTSPHIACERLFKLSHGADVVQVPFQGGGPAVLSTLAGQTEILHITLPLVAEHVKAGKLRALAVADKQRSPALPDVPTLEEAGIPNHEVGYWTGVLVPVGTPAEVIRFLSGQIAQLLALPDVKDRLAMLGFGPLVRTPEDFALHIKAESAEWDRVVRDAKIKID